MVTRDPDRHRLAECVWVKQLRCGTTTAAARDGIPEPIDRADAVDAINSSVSVQGTERRRKRLMAPPQLGKGSRVRSHHRTLGHGGETIASSADGRISIVQNWPALLARKRN